MHQIIFIFRLYYSIFSKEYGKPDGEQMLNFLQNNIERYNSDNSTNVKMKVIGRNLCIAICTDLMKRIHAHIRQSGELVFVDGSGGMDRHGCRIFLVVTRSSTGGLPLGVLITTSESKVILTEGFQLLKDMHPSYAFFGRGKCGPRVFMTDDSEAERKALHLTYKDSTLLLCTFHILQAMWRFFWDGKHKITKEHRPQLLKMVKRLLYCNSEQNFDDISPTGFE